MSTPSPAPAVTTLPDAAARDRIQFDHDTTLIVEAAAGTGKTFSVVSRVVKLIATGRINISQLVAMTFTKKAAGELRLRIRDGLETRIETEPEDGGNTAVRQRLEAALAQIEEAAIGTIHSFCSTILRERPVEAGVDPDFDILTESAQRTFFEKVFRRFVDRQLDAPGPGVARLLRRSQNWRGGPLDVLREAGLNLLDHRALDAPWERRDWDGPAEVHNLLHKNIVSPSEDGRPSPLSEQLRVPCLDTIEQIYRSLPPTPPGEKPNWLVFTLAAAADLAREIRLRAQAGVEDSDWVEQALVGLRMHDYSGKPPRKYPNLREWRDNFRERLMEFRRESNADLAALLREDLRELVEDYENAKAREGMLDFDDLLLKTRELLAANADLRRELRDRFRQVVIDEYQDTDPIQTEIALLLTAEDAPDGDWMRAVPLPGRLFLVGDPKQSIYRFRRADINHYLEVKEHLLANGAAEVRLTTNRRSVPGICDFVNEVMEPVFEHQAGVKPLARQVPYSPLHPYREPISGAGSLATIPVPHATYPRDLTSQEPKQVADFVARLLGSGFLVSHDSREGTKFEPVTPRDICLLFRRFRSWRGLVPQPYADALRDLGIPHTLAAVQSYIGSAELSSLRAALTAIEFPDDELSVYATLRGPLFAVPDQDLFLFRERRRGRLRLTSQRPELADEDDSESDRTIREALDFLYRLHQRRNHQPIAVTIQELLSEHRAETGFAFWKSSDQVLSNLRRLTESARVFEAEGGLSFRAFVEQLDAEAAGADTAAAHAMDEDVGGVRMMTVHAAKGLEFPVVVLCDAALQRTGRAQRIVRPRQQLHACELGTDIQPWDLIAEEETEIAEDLAELDRMLYVAATRARDLLAAPTYDLRFQHDGFLQPVCYGLQEARKGRSDELQDLESLPEPVQGDLGQRKVRVTSASWDALRSTGDEQAVKAGRAAEAEFLKRRKATLTSGSAPGRTTATAKGFGERLGAAESEADAVEIHTVPHDSDRPGGADFGLLAHRVLEEVALDGSEKDVRVAAELAARELELPVEYAEPAARAVSGALAHEVLLAARRASSRGDCYRELPLLHFEEAPPGAARAEHDASFETGSALETDEIENDAATFDFNDDGDTGPTLVRGVADLVYRAEADGPWTVVDFKTDDFTPGDPEHTETETAYRHQVALYARAVSRATGAPAKPVLLFL